MRYRWLLAVVVVFGLVISGPAVAQEDTLIWFNASAQIHPDGNGNVPHDASSNPMSLVGAMVQLILADGSSPSAPAYGALPNPENTDGITGAGESVLAFGYFGLTFTADGFFSQDSTFANLGINQTDEIFVRVYSEPSSNGSGNIPTPQVYTDADLLALYPEATGTPGTFYFDGPVQLTNAENLGGGFFGYTIPTVAQSGWTFLAAPVPEPGTFALAGLGGLALLLLRRRRR